MTFDRRAAEDFLFAEARLLDEWRLEEWAELFDEQGEYLVPSNDLPDAEPSASLYLINDDRHRLTERAKRLLKKSAHAEFPRSRVRHFVTNVQVEAGEAGLVRVLCNCLVSRNRGMRTDLFPSHAIYDLNLEEPERPRIRRKKVVIDSDTLRSQGRVSIIL